MNTPDIPEVEWKILDVDFEKLSWYLETHWAKLVFDGRINAQWLININGKKVRVREEWDVVKVEHKKKLEGEVWVKTFKETGFSADDFDAVINTFLELWLTPDGLASVKQRVSYILNGSTKEDTIRVDFDTY